MFCHSPTKSLLGLLRRIVFFYITICLFMNAAARLNNDVGLCIMLIRPLTTTTTTALYIRMRIYSNYEIPVFSNLSTTIHLCPSPPRNPIRSFQHFFFFFFTTGITYKLIPSVTSLLRILAPIIIFSLIKFF